MDVMTSPLQNKIEDQGKKFNLMPSFLNKKITLHIVTFNCSFRENIPCTVFKTA